MAARKPIVGGNWKCNPNSVAAAEALIDQLEATNIDTSKVDVVVFPVGLHIPAVSAKAKSVKVGCQNPYKAGAFTGELNVEQIKDCGMEYVLVGHSERRNVFGETDAMCAERTKLALDAGLNVLFCIGELLSEREAGETDKVCARQIEAIIPVVNDWSKVVIAYEPVWAIGTGVVATPDQAQAAHAAVRQLIKEKVSADVAAAIRIQYGGSVSGGNCEELIALPDVDGFLVGGAALKPEFGEKIVKAAAASN